MIFVKEVLKLAAALLGVEDRVNAYLAGNADEENTRVTEGLLACFQLVESEVAIDYLPLVVEEQVTAKNGKIEYTALAHTVARVMGVFDGHGNGVSMKITGKHIEVPAGTYVVRYAMIPKEKAVEDCIDHQTGVSERLLAYGVASEYCLHKGMYAEHAAWDKKYRNALCETYRSKGMQTMKARNWV